MRFGFLVFDLDGTLVDTTPALSIALAETLSGLSRPSVSVEAIGRITGHGLRALLRSAILMTGGPISDRALSEAVLVFRAAYERNLLERAVAAEGARDAIARVVGHGVRAAVLTNKPTQSSAALLAHLGYGDLLEYVVGGDLDMPRKPDPGGLLTLIEHWRAELDSVLLVGSSRIDLQTARNADVHVALVCPFGARQRVFGLGGDYTLESFEQLESLVFGAQATR
jgi:phosphoglycolate phosphatase